MELQSSSPRSFLVNLCASLNVAGVSTGLRQPVRPSIQQRVVISKYSAIFSVHAGVRLNIAQSTPTARHRNQEEAPPSSSFAFLSCLSDCLAGLWLPPGRAKMLGESRTTTTTTTTTTTNGQMVDLFQLNDQRRAQEKNTFIYV